MKYTLEQLQAMSNDELDRLAAEVQGWHDEIGYGRHFWTNNGSKAKPNVIIDVAQYHPTRDKAQAWDLMVKAELRAVVIAFILAKQGVVKK